MAIMYEINCKSKKTGATSCFGMKYERMGFYFEDDLENGRYVNPFWAGKEKAKIASFIFKNDEILDKICWIGENQSEKFENNEYIVEVTNLN